MKKIRVILLLFIGSVGFSQGDPSLAPGCDVTLPPNYMQMRKTALNSTQNMVSSLKSDTCLNKKFSIAFHIVMDSNYVGGVSPATLNACILNLNKVFKRICVSFETCKVDSIPNYTYNNWIKDSTELLVTPNWDVDETINIYLPDSIKGSPAGFASFPPGTMIVVEKPAIAGNVTIHEMGHFFGLPHTFDEIDPNNPAMPPPTNVQIASHEWVRRTNCYQHGDGFCDTEADCYPSGFNKNTAPCQHIPGSFDGFLEYYVPPVDNYMTYFGCGCRFTQEQYNFMARVILTQRMNLH